MNRKLQVLSLLIVAAGVSFPEAAASQVPEEGLHPGDQIEISLFTAAGERLPMVDGERIVDRNGDIFLPFLGSVRVSGLDAAGIREVLAELYSDIYSDPVVDVRTRVRINVTGAVRAPGHFFVNPTSTIVDALSTAGGVLAEIEFAGGVGRGGADLARVRLVREGETRVLDLRPDAPDLQNLNLIVRSGDWLHVPPLPRAQLRDNIQFFGSIVSLVGSLATLIIVLR